MAFSVRSGILITPTISIGWTLATHLIYTAANVCYPQAFIERCTATVSGLIENVNRERFVLPWLFLFQKFRHAIYKGE